MQVGVEGVESSLNAETNDKQYIRAGKSTTKKGTQRKFSIKGDRYSGDEFQDYALSETVKYGVGNDCVVDYVYFNYLTGKGEKGKASLMVNTDAAFATSRRSNIYHRSITRQIYELSTNYTTI